MSAAALSPPAPFRPQLAALRLVMSFMIGFGVFLSGFVISEPAPYELMHVVLVGFGFLFGLKISRNVAPLLALLLVFNVGGFLSLTMMSDLSEGPMYLAVSTFLALTSVFYAAVIESDSSRLGLIFKAWTLAAVITSTLGILGYFHALPGMDVFTRYDRAMGAFQDPNVFGPFLIAPALHLIYGLLSGRLSAAPWRVAGLLILALGVFLSFSRAAWALLLFCPCLLVFVMLLKERTGTFRLKILVLALLAVIVLFGAVVGALQSEKVSSLFSSRAQLEQEYDAGHLGRFERHRIGFQMAMEHPLGIGPMVFSTMFPEAEHNIWLKSLTTHGWLGFAAYLTLMIWTLSIGFKYLLRHRPWQPYLMIAWITVLGHVLIGNVIDTDHWRHFFLLLGIIWGCRGLERRHERQMRHDALTTALTRHPRTLDKFA